MKQENSKFKPALLCLKIDLLSNPSCGGEIVCIYMYRYRERYICRERERERDILSDFRHFIQYSLINSSSKCQEKIYFWLNVLFTKLFPRAKFQTFIFNKLTVKFCSLQMTHHRELNALFVLGITLNCIWWWGSTSEAVGTSHLLPRCHYSLVYSDPEW